MLQLVQLQIRGHDQRLVTAIAAVDDAEHLLKGILGVALRAQVVYNQQVIVSQAVQKVRPVLSERPAQAGQDGGEVGHEYGYIPVEKGVCDAPGREGFTSPHVTEQQQSDVPLERLGPMVNVCVDFCHSGVPAVIVGEGVAVEVTVLKSLGLSPLDALHALTAFLGLLTAALRFLLAGADTPGLEAAALERIGNDGLPGASALPAMEQAVSGVKVFVLADLRHTVSPSFTL